MEGNPKVNYLIAACAHRRQSAAGCIDPAEILRHHFRELLKVDFTLLTQITILQALPLNRIGMEHTNRYYDIQEFIDQIPCKVEFLPLQANAFSYGSWSLACKQYEAEFDYYILIEDDYYPAHPNFVEILLNLHREKLPDGGYLGSFIYGRHAAVSNGMVDVPSFIAAIESIEKKEAILEYLVRAAQVNFSLMFGEKIDDYADEYRVLFNVDRIECTHDGILDKEDIFNPVQYIENPCITPHYGIFPRC